MHVRRAMCTPNSGERCAVPVQACISRLPGSEYTVIRYPYRAVCGKVCWCVVRCVQCGHEEPTAIDSALAEEDAAQAA